MTDYVYMPKADYDDICDAIREKGGTTDTAIVSGEAAGFIRAIQQSGTSVSGDNFRMWSVSLANIAPAQTSYVTVVTDQFIKEHYDDQRLVVLITKNTPATLENASVFALVKNVPLYTDGTSPYGLYMKKSATNHTNYAVTNPVSETNRGIFTDANGNIRLMPGSSLYIEGGTYTVIAFLFGG